MALDDPDQRGGYAKATAALGCLYLAWTIYAVSVQRFFFADGSHFFLKLLEDRWFIYGDDYARHHAHYLTQAPLVLLTSLLGARSVGVLSWTYGLSLHLPQLIGLVACYFVVRRIDVRYMVFPLAALFGIDANQGFMAVHEAHVTASLFWPLLLYVLLHRDFDWGHAVTVIALSVFFIRTYESVAILGAILILLLVRRIRGDWGHSSALTRFALVATGGVIVAGMVIAISSALFPRVPGNRSDFFDTFSNALRHAPLVLSIGLLAGMALFVMAPAVNRPRWPFSLALVLSLPLTVFVAFSPVSSPKLFRPDLHHTARSVIILLPALLSMVVALVAAAPSRVSPVAWKRAWILMGALAVGQSSWQVVSTGQWNGYRKTFLGELARHDGPTPYEATILGREYMGIQALRVMTWGWTQPTLSILWAKDHLVRTVILNPASESARWQPFDPMKSAELPRLEGYGFSMAPYASTLAPAPSETSPR